MRGAILRRGRRMGRLLAGGILSIVMLMTAVGAPSAEESISVACYFGDRLVGDGVVVFDVSSAAQACNGLFYDCRGRCFGCFHDFDYAEDVCVDMYGRTFLR